MNFYKGKSVLVAGGGGFIGQHLVSELLGQGANVTVFDNFMTGRRSSLKENPALKVVTQDIILPLPETGPVDVVFNLACPASPRAYQSDPVATWRTSVYGTDNLLDLALASKARFVQASTSEVYGDPLVSPQPESYVGNVSPTGPRACYDEGKRAAECLIMDTHRTRGLDTRIARLFNTYGPGMQPDDGRVVSAFLGQALDGKPLTVFGDGTQTRSFCYVSDCVAGLMAMGARAGLGGEIINLGNSDERTILDLAKIVARLTGVALNVTFEDLPPDDPQIRRPDISRARSLLDWAPQIQLEEGLRLMMVHLRASSQIDA
ncbi:MAG TPA: NAD-dependent epimerase/dehydratase family protein [Aliiroseovarius sp.]|nr:NAD-dependent epimerase/dehydratase family protein [Aliiroseovarius sp.]